MTVSELARVAAALDVRGDGRIGFSSVSTDTRTLAPGALYVALRGERFDGHDYVAAAREGGAGGRAGGARRRGRPAAGRRGELQARTRTGGSPVARAVLVAGHRGGWKQREDHGDAMIASILAVAHGDKGRPGDAGQPQQRHRRAADAVATRQAAPRRRVRTRHEPRRRDRLSRRSRASHRRAGQQRAARAPGIHAVSRSDGVRERRSHRRAAAVR